MLAMVALLSVACNSNVYYSESCAIDEMGWNLSDPVTFDIGVADTQSLYDLFVDMRVSTNFPYGNAFLFLTTVFPDKSVSYDTLECPIFFPDGSPRGKKVGRFLDNRYYFKRHVVFPDTGTYHFVVSHGMRDTVISGIKDIGMRLECCEEGVDREK